MDIFWHREKVFRPCRESKPHVSDFRWSAQLLYRPSYPCWLSLLYFLISTNKDKQMTPGNLPKTNTLSEIRGHCTERYFLLISFSRVTHTITLLFPRGQASVGCRSLLQRQYERKQPLARVQGPLTSSHSFTRVQASVRDKITFQKAALRTFPSTRCVT